MIFRLLRNTLFLILLVFVLSTWGNVLQIGMVKPDIILIVIVWLALRQGPFYAHTTGFFTGFVEDILSLSPIGFHLTARTLVGMLVGLFRDFVGIDRIILPMAISAAASLLQAIWFSLISVLFSIDTAFAPLFSLHFLYTLLYTIICAPLVFWILELFTGLFYRILERFR